MAVVARTMIPLNLLFLLVFAFGVAINDSKWQLANVTVVRKKDNASDRHDSVKEWLYTDSQVSEAYRACRTVYYCLLVLCTVGNVLNLIVLLRSVSTWKTSACHYMIGTAIADLAALWCGLIEFLPTEGLGYYHLRGLSTPILSWFCEAAMSLSDWILVVFSWERLLIIVSPFRFGFLQRVLAARLIIVVLVILSLACYAFRFVKGYIFETVHDYHVLQSVYGWHFIWERVDNTALVVVKILTFLLILVPNVILIAFLVRQQRSSIGEMRRNQQAHSGASTSTSASKSLSQHGINIILLSSALLYLITRTPKFFDLCARAIPPRYYWNFSYMDDDSIHTLVKPVIMVSTYCGYSLNFYIYLLTERQYRRRFVELVARPACHPCFPTMFANGDDEQRTGDREMNERHPANTINSAIHSSDS